MPAVFENTANHSTHQSVVGRLAGRSGIVTGAAGGIGSCIARLFSRAGADVVVADIRDGRARSIAAEINDAGGRARSSYIDITDPRSAREAVDFTVREWGRLDFLVHAAAIDAPRGKAWELDDAHWRRIIDIDLNGAWWCCKAVMPTMIAQGYGRVILMSSISYRQGSDSVSVAYNTAKAAIAGMTIGLAKQVERHGVLVNAIAPGSTGTGEPMTPEELAYDEANFPLKIVGPDPVADAALYLCGDSGSWVSGTVLNVSGGRMHG